MAKLYYGNGNCSIEGSDIRGVQIQYRGRIELTDKTSDNFAIGHRNSKIVVFPIGEGFLNDLFDYMGEINIISVIAVDNNAEKVSTTIHKVMDYAELLNTNAEDMTTLSEDLKAGYTHSQRVSIQSITKKLIEGLYADNDTRLYLASGMQYYGDYHIHLENGISMTGGTHSKDSETLFTSKYKNPTLGDLKSTEYEPRKKIKTKRKSRKRSYGGSGGGRSSSGSY